ncbi:MAG: hypothetical protein HY650_05160 [Acidobacteria bacterium]|nr:hypothetical protein [Acidobacteriota bacterium]
MVKQGLITAVLSLIGLGAPWTTATSIITASNSDAERPVYRVFASAHELLLDHPLIRGAGGTVVHGADRLPAALKMAEVTAASSTEVHQFRFRMHADIDTVLPQLDRAQFSVFVDHDFDGVSDFMITTARERFKGVILSTPDLRLVTWTQWTAAGPILEFTVPRDHFNETFDWLAVTGYAPPPTRPLRLQAEFFLAPTAAVTSSDPSVRWLIDVTATLDGDGGFRASSIGSARCPPLFRERDRDAGGPRTRDGHAIEDWLISSKDFPISPGRTLQKELWCISADQSIFRGGRDYFAKLAFLDDSGDRVFDSGEPGGWIGICPYEGGLNEQWETDLNEDGTIDLIVHVSTDAGLFDDDWDGRQDTMMYEYDVRADRVAITHLEHDRSGQLLNRRTIVGQPFSDPANVPRSVE